MARRKRRCSLAKGCRSAAPGPAARRANCPCPHARSRPRPGRFARGLPGPRPRSPSNTTDGSAAEAASRALSCLLQRLEPQAVRPRTFLAEATLLVFLVLAVVALEELHVAVALEREDVGRDAVQEPAIMADHHRATGELQQ